MPHRIVILGAGTGGTIMANRLRRRLSPAEAAIVVVDKDDRHVYQPGLLFVPFGLNRPEDITRSRSAQLLQGVDYRQVPIDRVELDEDRVRLEDGTALDYDVLVVATGTETLPQETEGMTGRGWRERMFDFYSVDGAAALGQRLPDWAGGRLVVNIVDMPIKCPIAPLEFAFMADWFFHDKGMRDRVELVFVTPLDGAFTKPVAAKSFGGLLEQKGIELVTEFNAGSVDGERGVLSSFDDREVPFDLLVAIPVHGGAAYVGRSPGLGDELGFVPTDLHTLQSKVRDNVFAIGDATNLPTSKAGSVTHFEADVLTDNIDRFLKGEPLRGEYDGHANCFIETGFNRAMLIDFNYETEPLPGKYPFAGVGPLPLLKESWVNHLGKALFQWLYWHMLLPGRDVPGISSKMPARGKRVPT